ncbi:hypothetical protein RRG08_035337 [Elysia crispata]|uniref:Uncharacterized protein n=1 Tax=Elysia crispata TaxID=231223 RepID=A0AAE0Y3B8_9GAST|nr:hypothetical protein RRG08_035337 [Elysia crispata]
MKTVKAVCCLRASTKDLPDTALNESLRLLIFKEEGKDPDNDLKKVSFIFARLLFQVPAWSNSIALDTHHWRRSLPSFPNVRAKPNIKLSNCAIGTDLQPKWESVLSRKAVYISVLS